MIRAIIRLLKVMILFLLPVACGIGVILTEIWISRRLSVFLGGSDGASFLSAFICLGMFGFSIWIFIDFIYDPGAEAYKNMVRDAMNGTERSKKEWWKV